MSRGIVVDGSATTSNIPTASGSVNNIPNIEINAKDGKDGKNGADGKSAYAYAVEGGYQGTEEEFAKLLNEGAEGYKNLMPLIYAGL